MSKKTLKDNKFGESILKDFDSFYIWDTSVNLAYTNLVEKQNISKLDFKWFWNDFSGYGEIFYFNDSKKLCNQFGENSSNMTVSSNSKRKPPNGRNNCALYNDPSLAELFEKTLNIVDLEINIPI